MSSIRGRKKRIKVLRVCRVSLDNIELHDLALGRVTDFDIGEDHVSAVLLRFVVSIGND